MSGVGGVKVEIMSANGKVPPQGGGVNAGGVVITACFQAG